MSDLETMLCNECGEVFILGGDLRCPFCGSTDYREQNEEAK